MRINFSIFKFKSSIELKDEYERLKQEMEKAEEDTQANFQKKRGVAAQKKEANMEKEEAEKYQKLTQQLVCFKFIST
jgi:structural maintenance of chromosome 1